MGAPNDGEKRGPKTVESSSNSRGEIREMAPGHGGKGKRTTREK